MDLTKNVIDREIEEIVITASGGPFLNIPIRKLKNVIFSPHRAGALDVAFKNMGEIVIKDLKLISKNLKPLNCKKAELRTVKKITSVPVKIN